MKRLKDDERIIGPMFPRLHVNDTEKGGPKAPPRNKMALYEQLSVPSRHTQPSKQLPEKKYRQYPDLTTPSTQVDPRNKSDEDDFTVPIFAHSVPNQESGKHSNGTKKETISSSTPYFNHMSKFQKTAKTSVIERNTRQEDRNVVHDLSNNMESIEEGSFRSMQTKNLERGDSVTSVLDCVTGLDITPDDVVGIIGQKCFWKARRTIANQQRVFGVQLLELHRLIKVQRLIAASPHLLLEDSSILSEPITPLPQKKPPLSYPLKPVPNISKRKIDPIEPSHKQEFSAQNTPEKASFSSIQNVGSWCYNQPHGAQWLIPVMSPSEGLIYKPYPGTGFVGPAHEGGGPVYGALGPHPQYQFMSFPQAGPPGYFGPLGMPVMNPAPFLVDQMNGPDFAHEIEDTEVQGSTASSPRKRVQGSKASNGQDRRNVLPLFPEAPAVSPPDPRPEAQPKAQPERPTVVIKVVPHNARTATESAARIFRSIQEERKR